MRARNGLQGRLWVEGLGAEDQSPVYSGIRWVINESVYVWMVGACERGCGTHWREAAGGSLGPAGAADVVSMGAVPESRRARSSLSGGWDTID